MFWRAKNHGKMFPKLSQTSFSGVVHCPLTVSGSAIFRLPGDFRSWESSQTLPALFIGPFEHVERFRNLKYAVKRITDIQSTVLSSSEGTAAIRLVF